MNHPNFLQCAGSGPPPNGKVEANLSLNICGVEENWWGKQKVDVYIVGVCMCVVFLEAGFGRFHEKN